MAPKLATWNGMDSEGNPLRWGTPGLLWNGFVPEPPNPSKKMPHLRVSLAFAKNTDHGLHDDAGAVSANLYGNPAYPTPPVTKAALDASIQDMDDAVAAQEQGGTAATADKNNKREALIGLLRQLAGYVQAHCNNDLATLLASGFQAVSTSHAPTPSVGNSPTILDIKNGNNGQLIIKVTPVKNSHGFLVRYAAIGAGGVPGPWVMSDPFTDSRKMPINGLTAGTLYVFQVRATLGNSQVTDWSDAVQHMSM